MANVNIEISDADLQKAIANLAQRAGDLTPAMEDIGEYMLGVTRGRFDTETPPDRSKRPALNPQSLRRKQATSGTLDGILTYSGILRDTMTYRPGKFRVTIGTNRPYGAIHQFGGQAGRGGTARIPARPFLGANASDRKEIVAILAYHFSGG
jgi:phage virion morphogenesis protein